MSTSISEIENFDLFEDWSDLDFPDKLTALKASVSLPEVVELMGLDLGTDDKIPSPWNPDERTPSCHVYEDHFFDFSTGQGGDIFDLVMALNPGTELPQAVQALWKRSVKVGKEYGEVELQKPRTRPDFTEELMKYDTAKAVPGIRVSITPHFGLRRDQQGNIYVPHRDPEGVYGVKVRWADGGKGSWAGSVYMTRLYSPYGWDSYVGPVVSKQAVICEGESDAWAMCSTVLPEMHDVFALPSGAGSWKDHWLEDLEGYEQIWVCMDNDRAGVQARDKLLRKIGYERTRELKVPQLYEDARSAIEAGWVPFSP